MFVATQPSLHQIHWKEHIVSNSDSQCTLIRLNICPVPQGEACCPFCLRGPSLCPCLQCGRSLFDSVPHFSQVCHHCADSCLSESIGLVIGEPHFSGFLSFWFWLGLTGTELRVWKVGGAGMVGPGSVLLEFSPIVI